MSDISIGATVKMTRHLGALFLYTIINRIGDDCDIKDARGRIIPNVPVEFLERVGESILCGSGATSARSAKSQEAPPSALGEQRDPGEAPGTRAP